MGENEKGEKEAERPSPFLLFPFSPNISSPFSPFPPGRARYSRGAPRFTIACSRCTASVTLASSGPKLKRMYCVKREV